MWDPKSLQTLKDKRAAHVAAGGEARTEKQHASGKMTARERLEYLFDRGSFVELNSLVESRINDFGMDKKKVLGDGVITGYGRIGGKLVYASSQDFTVGGGSLGEAQAQKICRVMDMAYEMRAPFLSINDSGGARIEEGIDSLSGYAGIFLRHSRMSGVVPQIAAIMGPCAGGACYAPALCDFIFMTESTSQMYITGPAVIKAVTGETVTTAELGGAAVHTAKSGVAHFSYPDDKSCLNGIRLLIGYLPSSYEEKQAGYAEDYIKKATNFQSIVPDNKKTPYDIRRVIDEIADRGTFLEVQAEFAKNIVVGFIRIGHKTVGVVANQPDVMAGSLDFNAGDKAARFIRFCDCFNIPILTLVDVPAFLPGKQQEYSGIIRHGAKMLYAYSEATVPKVSVILRKAYGGAYIAMNSKGMGADVVYAWPIAEIAVMGADGAANIIGRKRISAAADPDAERAKIIAEYEEKFMNPYVAAARGFVDEVILPEETKEKIVSAFIMLESKKQSLPAKKHGNIPL